MSERPQIGTLAGMPVYSDPTLPAETLRLVTPPPRSRAAELAALRADLAHLAALVAETQTHLTRLEARRGC